MPNFTLEGHEKGVNCVDYFTGGGAVTQHADEATSNCARGVCKS